MSSHMLVVPGVTLKLLAVLLTGFAVALFVRVGEGLFARIREHRANLKVGPYVTEWIRRPIELWRARRSRERFEIQLVDALDTLAGAVRSGASLAQAWELVARETSAPLGDVLRQVQRETGLGLSQREALQRAAGRVGSADFWFVVAAIALAQETGGRLGETLARLAEGVRRRGGVQGRVKALTAQGRLSGWVMGAMPFALLGLLTLVSPDMVAPLFQSPLGWLLLACVTGMVAVGGLVIRRIVTVDV